MSTWKTRRTDYGTRARVNFAFCYYRVVCYAVEKQTTYKKSFRRQPSKGETERETDICPRGWLFRQPANRPRPLDALLQYLVGAVLFFLVRIHAHTQQAVVVVTYGWIVEAQLHASHAWERDDGWMDVNRPFLSRKNQASTAAGGRQQVGEK